MNKVFRTSTRRRDLFDFTAGPPERMPNSVKDFEGVCSTEYFFLRKLIRMMVLLVIIVKVMKYYKDYKDSFNQPRMFGAGDKFFHNSGLSKGHSCATSI